MHELLPDALMVPLFWLSLMPVNIVVHGVDAACALRDVAKTKRDAAIMLATVLARISLLIVCLLHFFHFRVVRTTGPTYRFGRGPAVYPFELAALSGETIGEGFQNEAPSAVPPGTARRRSNPGYAAVLAMPIGELCCYAAMRAQSAIPIHAAMPAMQQSPHSITASRSRSRAEGRRRDAASLN